MRRSTRKRNPPARHEDHDEPPRRKRQPQKKSQPPTAHKVPIPPRGPTQQHGLHSSSTVSPNSHTSTPRAPTLPARARTSSPVTAIPQQADMAQQCLEKDIKLENRQDKMRHSTRKRKPPARLEDGDEPPRRKRQPQKKSQPPTAHKVPIPPRGPTQQHGLHYLATASPNSHTSTSRAPTLPARASTLSPNSYTSTSRAPTLPARASTSSPNSITSTSRAPTLPDRAITLSPYSHTSTSREPTLPDRAITLSPYSHTSTSRAPTLPARASTSSSNSHTSTSRASTLPARASTSSPNSHTSTSREPTLPARASTSSPNSHTSTSRAPTLPARASTSSPNSHTSTSRAPTLPARASTSSPNSHTSTSRAPTLPARASTSSPNSHTSTSREPTLPARASTSSPNSHTSTSRAPTLPARASTSSPNSHTSTSREPTLPARASTSSPNSHTSTSRAHTLTARASTLSPNSHTSTSRAHTLTARASTSSPVTAIPQQADMAQQCLEKDIKLENRQEKMRRSTRKRNPPARHEDHDEPAPRKRQPQKKSQPPTAHKVPIPPRGPTQQHGLHSSATVSPNSHTSTPRAPTLPSRARTSSPVAAIPPQADMAQQCFEQDIKLTNRQDKMKRSTRKRKPPVRLENHDKTTLRKRQPQATPPHSAQIIQKEAKRQSISPSVATSSSRPPTPPTRTPTPPHVISIPPQVDMTQQLLEQNIPLVNEQEGLEMTQSSDIEISRKTIIKNFVALKKYLHPDPIIDCDTGFELLNVADRRNIQGKDPTDKNETILKKVISKGAKGYTDFKERLKKTWQTELLELIVCAENGQDTTEIECRLRKTALLCPQYIKQRSAQPYVSHHQKKLNEMWKKTGEKEIVYKECEKICKLIESMTNSILHIWPAYDTKANDDIVFVVLTKSIEDKLQIEEELGRIGYNIFVINIDSSSKESEQAIKKQTKLKANPCHFQVEDIKNVINKHSDRLLQNHQYLSAISGSMVRSKNFSLGQSKHCVSVQSCIVLYVIVKGKVPLHENKFEDHIDGIPVDVREGTFETTILQSHSYFKAVKMGCQITSSTTSPSYGTLGGFFHHRELGLCGITCAHVVLDEASMHELRGEKKLWSAYSPMVFQPDTRRPKYQLGPVKEAVYKTGNEHSSGIDMAIFKLENRAPKSGHFPSVPGMCFETGLTLGTSGLKINTQVLKYGRTTELTKGFIEFKNTTVRKIKYERKYGINNTEFTYFLKNQMEIRPDISVFQLFNDCGDSGAFVFAKDTDNHLACIGMCVGKINTNAVVIPISVIQEELGVSQLYDFRWNHLSEKLEEIKKDQKAIHRKLDEVLKRLHSR